MESHGLVSPGDCSLQVATVLGGWGQTKRSGRGGRVSKTGEGEVSESRPETRQWREKGVELLLVVENRQNYGDIV